ncbi:hypothetical protein GQ457_01G023410 [Hibiscus cannabinus]
MHWLKWEMLCKPKVGGDLGLCNLRQKNRALLNKWIWRYGGENSSLWRKVVDAKYGYYTQLLCLKALEENAYLGYGKTLLVHFLVLWMYFLKTFATS